MTYNNNEKIHLEENEGSVILQMSLNSTMLKPRLGLQYSISYV